jgi:hypothetical protein
MKTVADRVELALDAALGMTFPASDPVAISIPEVLARPAAGQSDPDRGIHPATSPTLHDERRAAR